MQPAPAKLRAIAFTLSALILTLFPVYWVLAISLKSEADAFASPPPWLFNPVWGNYARLWQYESFRSSFINSIVITIVSVALSLAIAIPAAYALSRLRVKGSKLIAARLLLAYSCRNSCL